MVEPRPPFDPIKGGWIILLIMTLGVIAHVGSTQIGCILGVQALCERTGEYVRDIVLEIITAMSVLIAASRGNGRPPGE